MLSMLCARPRLAPHAPAHALRRAQGPDECRTRALRSASLVPVAEEQPAEEGTTRKEVRGRGPRGEAACRSRRRERECKPLTLHAPPSPCRSTPRSGRRCRRTNRSPTSRSSTRCVPPPPTHAASALHRPCSHNPGLAPACAVGREQAGVDEVPPHADQARGEPPAGPRPPDLGRPARGAARLRLWSPGTLCTLRTLRTHCTRCTLRTLRTLCTLCTLRTLCACRALRACRVRRACRRP